MLPGSGQSRPVIGVDRTPDALEALPINVALVRLRNECEPALAGLAPVALARLSVYVVRVTLRLTIGIRPAINGLRRML